MPTFQCQVESGMALEPQLESPEPYAPNQPGHQILLQFFDPGAARAPVLCKGKAGFFNDELHNEVLSAVHGAPNQHHLAVFEG